MSNHSHAAEGVFFRTVFHINRIIPTLRTRYIMGACGVVKDESLMTEKDHCLFQATQDFEVDV